MPSLSSYWSIIVFLKFWTPSPLLNICIINIFPIYAISFHFLNSIFLRANFKFWWSSSLLYECFVFVSSTELCLPPSIKTDFSPLVSFPVLLLFSRSIHIRLSSRPHGVLHLQFYIRFELILMYMWHRVLINPIFPPMGLEFVPIGLCEDFPFLTELSPPLLKSVVTVLTAVSLFLESVLFGVEVSNEMFEIKSSYFIVFVLLFCWINNMSLLAWRKHFCFRKPTTTTV